ncbi:BTAD domain-containing putative transcriptional regulator [Luedemannella flava]
MIHTTRASLRFQILGPVRAWLGDDELDLGAVKQRAVLATLLVNLNRPVPVAQIVDAVWGDRPPENGPNVVQKYVAGLRRTLEPGRSARAPGQLIALTDGGYVLTAPADAVDAEVFERLVRDAEAAHAVGGAAAAGDLLSRALGRWQPPLAGLTGTYFDATRDRLAERRAAALELSADLALDEGRAAAIVGDLTTHVAEYPLRERLRYQLILALYRSGRQPEALAAFRDARQFLIDEFGVEPGAALQELHQRILRGDPDLLPVATAGTWEPPSTVSVAVEPTPEPTAPRVAVAPVAPGRGATGVPAGFRLSAGARTPPAAGRALAHHAEAPGDGGRGAAVGLFRRLRQLGHRRVLRHPTEELLAHLHGVPLSRGRHRGMPRLRLGNRQHRV